MHAIFAIGCGSEYILNLRVTLILANENWGTFFAIEINLRITTFLGQFNVDEAKVKLFLPEKDGCSVGQSNGQILAFESVGAARSQNNSLVVTV